MAAFLGGGVGSVGRVGGRDRRALPVPPLTNPNITINTDGRSATWNDGTPPTLQPDVSPLFFYAQRTGFDASFNPTQYSTTHILTERMRTPYNGASSPVTALSANQVAPSNQFFISDTIIGRANNSTRRAPKPVGQWITQHRTFISTGNLEAAIVPGHLNARLGQQIRGVRYIASDGVNPPVIRDVIATVPVAGPYDKATLEAFRCPADIADTLNDGKITVQAELYPWFGEENADYALSSVRKSAQDFALSPNKIRSLMPRYFEKRSGGWPIAYINSAGTATAASAGVTLDPSITSAQATNTALQYSSLRTLIDSMFTNAANIAICGGILAIEVRVRAGTLVPLGSTTARQGGTAALILTRDPRDAKASCIVAYNAWASNMIPPAGAPFACAIMFKDITVQRTGNGAITTNSGSLEVFGEHVEMDMQTFTANMTAGNNQWNSINGMRIYSSTSGGALAFMTLGQVTTLVRSNVLLRGIECDMNNSGTIEAYNMHACRILRPAAVQGSSGTVGTGLGEDNMCCTRNQFLNARDNAGFSIGAQFPANGVYVSGNIWEHVDDPLANPALGIARDNTGPTASTHNVTHVILEHNAWLGAEAWGRQNFFYTDGPNGGARVHEMCAIRGCVFSQPAIKSDLDSSDGTRTGNWGPVYGVDFHDNFFYASGSTALGTINGFRTTTMQFPGLNTFQNTDVNNWTDPGLTDYRAARRVGGVNIAGAGIGTYTTVPGSPLRGRVPESRRVRNYDLAGTAVTGGDDCGPYRMAA